MTDPRDFNDFERKLIAATQTDRPSSEFVTNLWQRIKSQPPRPAPRPAISLHFSSFRWRFAVLVLIAVFGAFLAIGPSRVIAALRSLLQYIPGIGYVEDSPTLRIVTPFEQTFDGITISIPAGVVDRNKTIIRYSFTGADLPLYDPPNPRALCFEQPYLLLPDGTKLTTGEGEAGINDHLTVEGRTSFSSIPAGVDSFEIVFPCLIQTEKKPLDEPRVLSLQLEPMPPDYPAYAVIELPTPIPATDAPIPTAMEAANPRSITFRIERIAELSDGYLFEGSIFWGTSEYDFVNFTPSDLQVIDANGTPFEIEQAAGINIQPNFEPGRLTFGVRTNRKDIKFPLNINLMKVGVSRTTHQPAFEIDLGSDPKIGQRWELAQEVTVEDNQVKITTATLIKSPFGPRDINYLEIVGQTQADKNITPSFAPVDPSKLGACPNGIAGGGGGGGGMDSGLGGFTTMTYLGCGTTGKVAFEINSMDYELEGPWSASVDLPVK
jgi:hypothetical protein